MILFRPIGGSFYCPECKKRGDEISAFKIRALQTRQKDRCSSCKLPMLIEYTDLGLRLAKRERTPVRAAK